EVERRMTELAALYAKFQKSYAKNGPSAKPVLKLRDEMAALFMTLKLPLPLTDTLVRNLRDVQGAIKDHERRILDLSVRVAKMPRKDFIRAWDGNQTNQIGRASCRERVSDSADGGVIEEQEHD